MALSKAKADEAANALLDEITKRAPVTDLLGIGVLADAYAAIVHGARANVGQATLDRNSQRRRKS